MPEKPDLPLALRVCGWMAALAARFIPVGHRAEWVSEWHAEIWHRWRFLADRGAWNRGEAWRLWWRSLGMFPDAVWYLRGQEPVRARIRAAVRSPWACLSVTVVAVLLLTLATWGLPATRAMLTAGFARSNARLIFVWFHPSSGTGDEGLPGDAVAAWAQHSQKIEGMAPFVVGHQPLRMADGHTVQPLVVRTERSLFRVLKASPVLGQFPEGNGVVVTSTLWRTLSRDGARLGARMRIGRQWYPVTGVMSPAFQFLSRQPAAYLIQANLPEAQQMVVARLKPGVSQKEFDRDLVKIAESACYYFFRGELRYSLLSDAAWIPLRLFLSAALCSALLILLVSKVPVRRAAEFWRVRDKRPILRRAGFFVGKVALAFGVVFLAGLEWSRSQSAILYGPHDPAASPLLLWLYILGSMGVWFWVVADQRARCRVCLRLLCFPVRVGCPGCLLLNWSGIELLCPEGHGMMHVPDLAPSWDEETERWIALDDSWKDLFVEAK